MESPNTEKLKTLIGFLNYDATNGGIGNIELAAANFLNENFMKVVTKADVMDEIDAQTAIDKVKA